MAKKAYKIALLCDDSLDKPDGVQQYVVTLGEWLRSKGHEVHYITSTTKRTDLQNVHVLGRNISVRFNKNRLHIPLPITKRTARRLLQQEQFDIVHIQMPYSPLLAGKCIYSLPQRTALFGTFHIYPDSVVVAAFTRALGVWVRRQLRRFDRIVSVSSAAQTFSKKSFRIRTDVMPNVVDVQRFLLPAKKTATSDVVRIVFLGRLVERKGCFELLKAIAYIQEQQLAEKKFVVIIGGKGPLLERCQEFVVTRGLGDVVQFAGFIAEEDKASFLAQADIAAFPSTGGESFGISLVEAMAAVSAGVVLGGDNPGYRTVLTKPEQLVDPKDTEAFARTIAKYINSPELRHSAVTWQQDAAKTYDTSVVGAKIVAMYTEALRSRRR